jgi:hypothetical protein
MFNRSSNKIYLSDPTACWYLVEEEVGSPLRTAAQSVAPKLQNPHIGKLRMGLQTPMVLLCLCKILSWCPWGTSSPCDPGDLTAELGGEDDADDWAQEGPSGESAAILAIFTESMELRG